MSVVERANELFNKYVVTGNHTQSDYFSLIRELVILRQKEGQVWQEQVDNVYEILLSEIQTNTNAPTTTVKFGTSGWRGRLGKDVFVQSAAFVTAGIVDMYKDADTDKGLAELLGINSFAHAKEMGCVVGFDNRFAGDVMAGAVVDVLRTAGFTVHYAGESTTGVLSAAVMELGAAFSINLTPSHNPLEYGGFKYNASDAGPAEAALTTKITTNSLANFKCNGSSWVSTKAPILPNKREDLQVIDSLQLWKDLVRKSKSIHGMDYDTIIENFEKNSDIVVVIDSVHGASRLHVNGLFKGSNSERLVCLRSLKDVTFDGIAPEPSSINMQDVTDVLNSRTETLKLGAIIDPDGDRIRFTDGTTEISMNQFGAMAYHFLHEFKGKKGMIAKTVATSNMANALGKAFGEEVYEPKVGFKEFKPVIGKALVYFEESDGISLIGHTPEKDAYIGLLLALDMVLTLGKNLGDYLLEIEAEYGAYYPDRDGVDVSVKGDDLMNILSKLEKYSVGAFIEVGGAKKIISEVIAIDGRKMIFEDNSWLMIRPSGTEPKVRFYVESRTKAGTVDLVKAAKSLLAEIGLLN